MTYARTRVRSGFRAKANRVLFALAGNFLALIGFFTRSHSVRTRFYKFNRWSMSWSLEQCFPTSKYATCTQSLPWAKS